MLEPAGMAAFSAKGTANILVSSSSRKLRPKVNSHHWLDKPGSQPPERCKLASSTKL
jgi:hypothetical protein